MSTLRRVVTGQSGPEAPGCITADGAVPTVLGNAKAGDPVLFEIWKTFASPARIGEAAEEPAAGDFALQPPGQGAVFRVAVIPPDAEMASSGDHPVFDQMEKRHGDSNAARLHRTDSIDFGIVISGSIWLLVDEGETEMKAGDVLVQRGANHAWSNRSDAPCTVAFVMLDARYA